jgi:hypothetical protein
MATTNPLLGEVKSDGTQDVLHVKDENGNIVFGLDATGTPFPVARVSATQLNLSGSTSGSAVMQAAAVAGSPAPIVLPLTTGLAGQLLSTDGGTPQQTSWVPASGGGSAVQTKRVSAGTIGSALISLPITINWSTPFADNNYTVVAQAVIGEATSDGAVTSIINIASLELLAGGAGVIVTVANADSIPHSAVIHLMAVHD